MLDRRQIYQKIFKSYDVLVIVFGFAIAAWASFSVDNGIISFRQFLSMRIKIQNLALFLGLLLFWHVLLAVFKLYEFNRFSGWSEETLKVLKAMFVGSMLMYPVASLFSISMITPLFLVTFCCTGALILAISRLALRHALRWLRRRGRNTRFMVIAGTNGRAVEFARRIESNPELGYRVAGFVDETWTGITAFKKTKNAIVSDFNGFEAYLRNNVVDEVVIALPLSSHYRAASRIAAQCEEHGTIVRTLPEVFNLMASSIRADYFEGKPLMTSYTGNAAGWQFFTKKVIDLVVSSILLIFFAPILIAVAVVIRKTSPGPALFIQERVGLNKRRFRLYKFRTMEMHAEERQAELEMMNEIDGPAFKIIKDPRITKVGGFLRRTSIDELPQLFNVLKGDMSLVGPRPLPVRDYESFHTDWHRRRFSILPGMTCLWQINGRSTISFEKWMELDMQYIDRWSLWLDVKILFRTFPAVLRGSGAA